MSKFNAKDYNFVAKRIREVYPAEDLDANAANVLHYAVFIQRGVLGELALNFAKKFKADNELFDPHKFLEQCSETQDYPLSILWEEEDNA